MNRTLDDILPLNQLVILIGKLMSQSFFLWHNYSVYDLAESGGGKSTFVEKLITQCHSGKTSI